MVPRRTDHQEPEAPLLRYQELFELVPNGYLTTDGEGVIVEANRAAEDLLGCGRDRLVGRPLMDFVPELTRSNYQARLEALQAGRAERIQDWRLVLQPDAAPPFDAEVTVAPVCGEGGVCGLCWLMRDVTERWRAEERLRDSERRLRSMAENLPVGAVYIERDAFYFNRAVEKIIGYTSSEITTLDQWFEALYGDRAAAVRAYYEEDRAADFVNVRTVPVARQDGTVRFVEFAGYKHDLGEVWLLQDVTEQKQTQEALRRERDFAESLVETAPAIVLVLGTDGRILRFNRYMEEISGYRLKEVRGEDWFSTFLPARHRDRIREVFSQALEGAVSYGSNPIVTKDGGEREIEWHTTLLREAGGEVSGVLAVGQDITERRRLEEEFRQAQKMEAVGRLAGGVAHDFNTLLGSIMGYSEILTDGLRAGDPLRRAAEQIGRGAGRGAALTRQLLAFSRRQMLQPKVLDLGAVVADMGDMLRRLLGEDVELTCAGEAELRPVRLDAGQIEQAIMNLVVNARDAMPRGGRITIETRNVDPDAATSAELGLPAHNPCILLAVSDTGCGMDEETRSHLFEPFFTTKEPGKGTGLGLSTVYGIVKQSGGGIRVDSEPGRGSTFRIYLPSVDAAKTAAQPDAVKAGPTAGTETVLLVEDDEMFRGLLWEILEANGYTVLAAADPAEALATSEELTEPMQLLVSDMVMPHMTGSELARALLKRHPEMRVVLMSGYTGDDLEQRGVSESDAAFLQKPFSTKDFLRTVREVLDSKKG